MKKKLLAISFLLLSVAVGALNDVFSRYALQTLSPGEVTLLRYFFATLTILPFMLKKREYFRTKNLLVHFIRGFVYYIAATLWVMGIDKTLLSSAVVIGFSSPFFIMLLCYFFLGERVSLRCVCTSIISFLAIVYTIDLHSLNFRSASSLLLFSCIFFAISDFLNKKFVNSEPDMTMVFYFNLFAFLISIPFVLTTFVMPSMRDLFFTFCLGASANCLLYFLLRAFMLSDASFLSPFRFFEFIFSAFFAYIFFSEIPDYKCYIAMVVIFCCNFFLFIEPMEEDNIGGKK